MRPHAADGRAAGGASCATRMLPPLTLAHVLRAYRRLTRRATKAVRVASGVDQPRPQSAAQSRRKAGSWPAGSVAGRKQQERACGDRTGRRWACQMVWHASGAEASGWPTCAGCGRLDGDLVITASEVSSRGAYLLSPQLLYGRLALTWGHVAACFTKRVKQS